VFDGEGRLIYFFASQLDVTRRKEAEDIMQQSQRMEALGSMACGVAHEFNNLLTIVMGSTQLATTRAVDDRQRDQLGRVEWAARKAGRLTHQMLSFARRQFHDMQPLELNQVVTETDSLLAQVVGSNVKLSFDLSPEALPVSLDPGQLELALINLARNAVDAMPDGGRLVIGTASYSADAAGRFVSLSVSDTGEGMSAETMRRATERFFTTKARGKGTGLGLSMVAGFAEQSGGRLDVASKPDAGTRITIVLPRREG
jgi:signal transduction histidine kinase